MTTIQAISIVDDNGKKQRAFQKNRIDITR